MMPFRRLATHLTATAMLWLLATPLDALAWRCSTRLIEPGLTFYDVRSLCGDPVSAEHRTEWRLQTVFQQQCQTVWQPPPNPAGGYPRAHPGAKPPQVFCAAVPLTYSVPVDIETWYYEDSSVPKALHFEAGRLGWIESLWHLRH
jgi:hypothetical protein